MVINRNKKIWRFQESFVPLHRKIKIVNLNSKVMKKVWKDFIGKINDILYDLVISTFEIKLFEKKEGTISLWFFNEDSKNFMKYILRDHQTNFEEYHNQEPFRMIECGEDDYPNWEIYSLWDFLKSNLVEFKIDFLEDGDDENGEEDTFKANGDLRQVVKMTINKKDIELFLNLFDQCFCKTNPILN